MTNTPDSRFQGLHVVVVGVDLDPLRRSSADLLSTWRDFGRFEAAVAEGGQTRVTIVQASWDDDRRDIDGLSCHFVREPLPVLTAPGGRTLRLLPRRLIARVKDLAPDVVHFNGLTFPRDVRALQDALPGVAVVAQDHGFNVPPGWRRSYYRWGLANLPAVMFCAREQADELKRIDILNHRTRVFEVIEISTPFQPGDRVAARMATGIAGDPCLLWLGNLDANKDPLMVLDAVALAAAALPTLRLVMCFRYSDLIAEVRGRIATDQTLVDRVTILGEVPYPGIEAYLRAADFLVQGSHREAGGCAVIEALACGTTPLVTDIPSFRRITGEGRFGALAPVGDAAALAHAIVSWSRRDRELLRVSARQHFERTLSFRAVGAQLKEAYRQLAGRS
jgi:glycosyltransferase involved in cell wall biosynthesis